MKRVYADRPNWQRVPQKRFYCAQIDTPAFTGWIAQNCLDEVREPLLVEMGGQNLCLAAKGYTWLHQFPAGEHYTILTMYDARGNVLQWYMDICLRTGVDERNIPWLDDLYLDLVVLPSGEMFLLDADELADALEKGDITTEEYDLAWREANRLRERIENGVLQLPELSESHRKILLEMEQSG